MARGLGRGLDALFLDTEAAYENAHSEQGVTEVDITNVFPNPDQPRKNFEENALAELSRSIKGTRRDHASRRGAIGRRKIYDRRGRTALPRRDPRRT